MSSDQLSATEVHAGTRLVIAPTGDYSIDTTEAKEGGDTVVRLKGGATLKVEIGGSTAFASKTSGAGSASSWAMAPSTASSSATSSSRF